MRTEQCPVCGVIIEDDVVKFSYGAPGTRDRLYARVCQYAKKKGCINAMKDESIENIKKEDYYGLEEKDLSLKNYLNLK